MNSMMRLIVLGTVLTMPVAFGGCGPGRPRADAMPIEVVLAKDVIDAGRSVQVDLVGVGAGEQSKFASKAVREWFRGGDADRAAATQNGTARTVNFVPGGATSQSVGEKDAFWTSALSRQAATLYVFAFVAGEDASGKDVAWRKELPLDPSRYEGERIRLEVQRGGVNVLNLKPEKK